MTLFNLLMSPSNRVCDRLGIGDEHERGMMRMLVNMILFTALIVVVGLAGWAVVA